MSCGPMQVRIRIDPINLEGGRQKQKYPAGLMKSGQKRFLAHLSSTPRGTRCNHSLGPTCSTRTEPTSPGWVGLPDLLPRLGLKLI